MDRLKREAWKDFFTDAIIAVTTPPIAAFFAAYLVNDVIGIENGITFQAGVIMTVAFTLFLLLLFGVTAYANYLERKQASKSK